MSAQTADLSISVVESVDPVVAGSGSGNLTYTVTLTNSGPDTATNVRVEVLVRALPGLTSGLQNPSVGTLFGRRFWDVPSIASGVTRYFQFWYRAPGGPGGTGSNLSDGLQLSFCD